MKTIVVNIDPQEVDLEDVEDFLATDDLFVEYFNVFLALPTFPVPLLFNKDTGGFEVVSDAKHELAKQIKDALRTQQKRPKIYRVAKKHSYMDIPLIPIEIVEPQQNQEIHTSFTVTTLNKEQGIHWIKEERLPAFLESDLYLEYRLSKLLSQARITGEEGEYVLMKIDFKPRAKKKKKKMEEEQVQIDPREAMMKNMYVSMGNASTSETDAWYSSAKILTEQQTTYTTLSRPTSESVHAKPAIRPTSARPASAYSDPYGRSDSGMGSSKGSAKNSSYGNLYHSRFNVNENDDDLMMSRLFSTDGKPVVPRVTETLCVVSKDHSDTNRPYSSTVYSIPKPDPDDLDESELGIVDDDGGKDDEKDSGKGDDENTEFNDSIISESDKPIVFENLDDIGSVIVGVVLKRVIAIITEQEESEIQNIPEIQKCFKDETHLSLTLDSLDKLHVLNEEKVTEEKEEKEAEVQENVQTPRVKINEDESDVDSLLDSDEDYEESDGFFRKHKNRKFDLCSRKGVDQFKKFLKGTHGERNWNFWVDIDRMRLMGEHEIPWYICGLREKYHKQGAEYELTTELKNQLGLVEPSVWTMDKLLQVQNQIVESLVLYWAPRFLIKQLMRAEPHRNLEYLHQKLLQPSPSTNPNPPAATLLPLRPKSCVPKVRTGVTITPHEQYSYMRESSFSNDTSPPVGMKRSYAESTLKFVHNWQKEQMVHHQLISPNLPVDRTSTPALRRPVSARTPKTQTQVQTAQRPKSAYRPSTRPSTARSTSSRLSMESATGRMRIKSAGPRQLPHAVKDSGSKSGSRPSSAASSIASIRSEGQKSDSSEFNGGRRMEHLLQVLHREPQSGGFFRRYVERSGNRRWLNNLNLWRDLQAYHLLFYGKSLDQYVVYKKAKKIYSNYIVVRAPHHVECEPEVSRNIYSHLDPPFEELFDEVEEHAIGVLYEVWLEMVETDQKTYSKVELIDVKRHLETKSKYVLNLQKSGLIKERVSTPDVMEGYEDPVYDEALLANIPDEFKDYTLEKLVHNRIELEHFRNFLAENYASMDIMCWMDIEAYRRIAHNEEKKRDGKAKEIKAKYLNKKYFFGPNSPAGKEGQNKVAEAGGGWGKLLEDRPSNGMILEAQKYVRDRLEKKWLPLFLATPDFAVRQKPRTGMDDVVEDVLVQKKKKSLNMLKLLDSRWVSSSNEIITFRKALLNPVTSLQFRRFASIRGDSLENDVLFWLEVQKYKDLYHAHCDDSMIVQKINTIINCFIDSQIPPQLQIDIPPEMAEKILDHKYEKSPYLFREAQLVTFRVLFPHWNEFCEFRSNLAEEKIMPLIERRRKHARAKEKKKQQELEDKQAKSKSRLAKYREAERRIAMGLPPLGDDDDAFHDPFKALGGGAESVDGEAEQDEKDKISWSYSNYMAALEKEKLLNNTDETSFSSLLTDTASVKSEPKSDQGSENGSGKPGKVDSDSQTMEKKKNQRASQESILGLNKRKSSRASSMDIPARGDSQLSNQSQRQSSGEQKVRIKE